MSGVPFFFDERINILFQGLGDHSIDLIFRLISDIFSELFFILLSIIIFWCYDKKTGIRLMCITFISAIMTFFLKSIFGSARPPQYIHKVAESGFGFPSGHAVIAAGSCMYLAGILKKRWIFITGMILITAVSLSRIYLGVHYVGDVIGGILFGFLLAFIILKKEKIIVSRFNGLDRRSKYFMAAIPLLILIFSGFSKSSISIDKIQNGLVMAGAGLGYLLEEDRLKFGHAKDNRARIIRLIIGSLVLAFIYLIPGTGSSWITTIKYILLGLASTFMAPWVFIRIEGMNMTGKRKS